jgi:hypothetical protein
MFFARNQDISVGSYRIWVNDLNYYFNNLGIASHISNDLEDIKNNDIIICAKSETDSAIRIKRLFPHKKVGIINLSSSSRNLPIDFVIVGSIEEMDSLAHYRNVFLFPLIEKMYQSPEDYKRHFPKEKLNIGFHGHSPHLSKFEPHLKLALEEFDKICDFELTIITSNSTFKWSLGRPDITNLTIKPWNFNTIKQDLLDIDVGLIPNATQLKIQTKSVDLGLYDTDFALRFKNKSNAGRCFVFHQLGIPVIADFTPSNFHILANPDCGFIANTKEGWLKSLMELRDDEFRQHIANNAKQEFDRLYHPPLWANRLYKNILEI